MSSDGIPECPFCDFKTAETYRLMIHVEELHTENSPFVAYASTEIDAPQSSSSRGPSSNDDGATKYVTCSKAECGEEILLIDLNEHLDLHQAEEENLDDPTTTDRQREKKGQPRQESRALSPRKTLQGQSADRHKSQPASSEKIGLGRSIFSFGLGTKSKERAKTADSQRNGVRLGVSFFSS